MTRRDRMIALAKKLGATIQFEYADGFYVDAPQGKMWQASGAHCIALFNDSGRYSPTENFRQAIGDMQGGLYDCECGDCPDQSGKPLVGDV